MLHNKQTVPIPEHRIPSAIQAVEMYEQQGVLTHWPKFGNDPLEGNMDLLSQRLYQFHQQLPSFDVIFHAAVNNNQSLFRNALTTFCDITFQLSP